MNWFKYRLFCVMKGFGVDNELLSECSLIFVFCPLVGSKVLCGVNTTFLKGYFLTLEILAKIH